jgi:glucose-1-phosphate thymidylyltransferase
MKALILAGGFARRLGPIGEQLPKPLLMVEGDRALNHLLRKLRKEGLEPIITVNQKFAKFFEGYGNLVIEEATREEEKLGAVSAIANAVEKLGIDDDLLVVCSDNYFSSDFGGFISSFTGEPLVGFYYAGRSPDMKPEEMATIKFEGCEQYPPPRKTFYVEDFKEKVKPPLSAYVGTGIYLLPKRVLPLLNEFCRGARRDAPGFFIQYLLERGERIKGYLFEGEWYDISHKSYWSAFKESELARADEQCVIGSKKLNGLETSLTILRPGKSLIVPGNSVHFFVEGEGVAEVRGRQRKVSARDVVLASAEGCSFVNNSDRELVFISVFRKE